MSCRLFVDHVTKLYGRTKALEDLTFTVEPGRVFGLLGRNGAGKTTIFGCSLGLVRPSSGRILFDDGTLTPRLLADIAYVPETPALYPWMTLAQHVEMQRRTFPRFDLPLSDKLINQLELPTKKKTATFSKGQKTAAALVLAFAQRPRLMLFDEPSSGLDPVSQHQLLELVVQASADGITIVFSSHEIGQVERTAEDVAILDHGRCILSGNLDDLRSSHKIVEAVFDLPPQLADLSFHKGIAAVLVRDNVLEVRTTSNVNSIVTAVRTLEPHSMRVVDQSLEEVFLNSIPAGSKVVL